MKIMILGHKGLLGNAVISYFFKQNVNIITVLNRWPNECFKNEILQCKCDYLINCIGKIPQRNCNDYISDNITLPIWLASTGIKMVQPSTDCEFKGTSDPHYLYKKSDKTDATDPYGISKRISTSILTEIFSSNVKVIRTSIVGIEKESCVSLLSWFLHQKESIKGFTNHIWNGITTLEWARQCHNVINLWDTNVPLIQLGTKPVSKYDLLHMFSNTFHKKTNITPHSTGECVNKCLLEDFVIPPLEYQLIQLKEFYNL